jgi:hypothetical protein
VSGVIDVLQRLFVGKIERAIGGSEDVRNF